jgi:CopG family nickel-responsive transcriptional regulator
VLKGTVEEVKSFADSVVTQRGVRFGNLLIIPSEHDPHKRPHSHD